MATQQIVSRWDSSKVLFECEVPEAHSGMAIRYALERATETRTNLRGADLIGANLRGANLSDANLRGVNLIGVNLIGADLSDADLSGANLRGADLIGANLRGANLRGADLRGKKLLGARPFISVGPIGSRSDYLQCFITDGGVMVQTGCFFGSRDEFAAAVVEEHSDSAHGVEYRAALVLVDAHAALWTPAVVAEAEAA